MHVRIEGIDEVNRTLSRLGNRAPIVLRRSLNKTLKNEQVFISRKIRDEVTLKASKVKQHLRIQRATRDSLQASIDIQGKPIGFRHYGARQTRRGVSVKIRKQKPRELVTRAFRLKNDVTRPGMRMVGGTFWKRVGRPRTPLKRLVGPSVPNIVAENEPLFREVLQYGQMRLVVNANAELHYELTRNE